MVALELGGRFVADGRMQSATIVEDFDVLENGGAQVEPCRPALTAAELGLERREEALGDGVVPAVSLAAHADFGAEVGECCAVVHARALSRACVRVLVSRYETLFSTTTTA